jgi:hypothetical protein
MRPLLGWVSIGKAKRGRINCLGLASLNNFVGSKLGIVSNCLVPGPGMIKAEEFAPASTQVGQVELGMV